MRIGNSYDLHNLIVGNGIFLGGVFIPCAFQVEAVSDGDVLLHSVSEAIIGALGLGDLGDWYDETNVGIKSTEILKKALSLMDEKNYQINNIDITIILDKPLLKQYKKDIKINLSRLLVVSADCINIKATTTENNFLTIIQAQTIILLK